MSGRARVALAATAATLLAACALLPLVDTDRWLLEAGVLLAIQAAVGALARRVPLARAATVAVQALVALLLLTFLFAREQAVAGFLPSPGVFDQFGLLFRTGTDDVSQFAIPAPMTDGIRLLLVGGVLVVGLAVDALAVTFRSAAPAGLPLLALYSVAAGLADGGTDWLWFLLAAAGYLLLLLAEGRDRLTQWGRVFGGPPRPSAAAEPPGLGGRGRPVAPLRAGRRIGVVALGIALVVPLALPALDGGLLDGAGTGSSRGPGGGGTISAVNPLVSLQNSLNQPEDRQVMSYRTNTDDTQNQYLRIVSLDEFDGTSWKPSVRHIQDVPGSFPSPPGLSSDVEVSPVRTRISTADWYAQDWLPMPYPASRVRVSGNWRYEPVGRTLVGDHGQTTRGADYDVESLLVRPTAQQLADASEPPPDVRKEFTEVPHSLPSVVHEDALKVTRGAANDYERAVKLQDWFAVDGGFTYNTQVQAGSGSEAIARFLKEKEGFCVHFAFTMAAMARTLDIPARVAVGFTPGTPQADGTMSVGLKDAHAWPELYFEGVGWTRFEPTPTRGTAPDYTLDQTPSTGTDDPTQPSQETSDEPSVSPSASESCSVETKKLGGCESAVPQIAGGGDGGTPIGLILGVTLGALAVLLLPLLPMLWRMRLRARRLGSPGRTPVDAAARTLAAWAEITDTAWDYGIAPDESQTPRSAAARIVRAAGLDGEGAESVHRAAGAVEQVLYAPAPVAAPGVGDDARRVAAALGAAAGRAARLRALFAPRSAVRVTWALMDRWLVVRGRWADQGRRLWGRLRVRRA
ncbi:DUF3488 and DUF4129 domain-containing transglutaminase family protein [Streptomyces sp. NPDC050560]|uniref:DUF3488 and DUF4129 domain-containing transglutaminase family protein n=1 Tax=Streptomyces sp. NPDC050560 TaxID=3365630 RepID=UPI00379A827E